jgi:hypothetical protein
VTTSHPLPTVQRRTRRDRWASTCCRQDAGGHASASTDANHAGTFDTRDQADDWLIVTRARSITGNLPAKTTVRTYGARWLAHYDIGPAATKTFHEQNLRLHIYPALGDC